MRDRHRQRQIAGMKQLARRRTTPQLRPQRPIGLDHRRLATREELLEEPLRLHFDVEHAPRRQLRRPPASQAFSAANVAPGLPSAGGTSESRCTSRLATTRWFPTKSTTSSRVFPGGGAQAAAELLEEDDLRLRRPEHHHAVDLRQIDPLVEQIDHAQRVERAGTKRL
jgi:hypothetical protein